MAYEMSIFAGSLRILRLTGSLWIKGSLRHLSSIIAANGLSILYECLTRAKTLIRQLLSLKLFNGLELHGLIVLPTRQSHGATGNLLLLRN